MEISAELRNTLVNEAIVICDAMAEELGADAATLGMYTAMTKLLIRIVEQALTEAEQTLS